MMIFQTIIREAARV